MSTDKLGILRSCGTDRPAAPWQNVPGFASALAFETTAKQAR